MLQRNNNQTESKPKKPVGQSFSASQTSAVTSTTAPQSSSGDRQKEKTVLTPETVFSHSSNVLKTQASAPIVIDDQDRNADLFF